MTSTIEALHRQWKASYAMRSDAALLEGASAAFEEAKAEGENPSEAERAYYAQYLDPHQKAQFDAEAAIFAQPSASLRDFSIKVLVAFTDNTEPDALRRDSLNADAMRFIADTKKDLPA